ncbi:MAG: hypothetical protein WBP45_13470, partial [Daejeonella sp.]
MKIFQFLILFLSWFTSQANATPIFTKVALPNHEVSFSKTENVKEESTVKIGEQNFTRSGIAENYISQKRTSGASYALIGASRAGEREVVIGAGNWATAIGKNIDELVEAPAGYQFYTRNEQKFIRRLNASDPNTPQLTVRYGKIAQATGKVLSNADEIKLLLKTDVNKAFFWSGRTSNGVGVMDMALEIAQGKGGTTLEGILEKYKITMPEFNDNIPSVVKLWEDVSALYATQVSGEVRAVLG